MPISLAALTSRNSLMLGEASSVLLSKNRTGAGKFAVSPMRPRENSRKSPEEDLACLMQF